MHIDTNARIPGAFLGKEVTCSAAISACGNCSQLQRVAGRKYRNRRRYRTLGRPPAPKVGPLCIAWAPKLGTTHVHAVPIHVNPLAGTWTLWAMAKEESTEALVITAAWAHSDAYTWTTEVLEPRPCTYMGPNVVIE